MGAATPVMQSHKETELWQAVLRRMIQVFGVMALIGLILFASAWTFDWIWAWVFLGIVFGF